MPAEVWFFLWLVVLVKWPDVALFPLHLLAFALNVAGALLSILAMLSPFILFALLF